AAIHPEEDKPEHREDGHALEKGRVGSTQEIEDVPAEVRFEAVADETFDQVAEAVRSNRVGANDPQGKRPERPAQPVDDRVRECQEKKADAAREKDPTGGQIPLTPRQDPQSAKPPANPKAVGPATRSQTNLNQGGRSRF